MSHVTILAQKAKLSQQSAKANHLLLQRPGKLGAARDRRFGATSTTGALYNDNETQPRMVGIMNNPTFLVRLSVSDTSKATSEM